MAASIISDKFRIYNAEQFVNALGDDFYDEENQLVVGAGVERHNMYFFVGRPQEWYSILEVYSRDSSVGDWDLVAPGDTITVDSNNFSATVVKVYPDYLLVSNVTGTQNLNTAPVVGSDVQVTTGAGSGATGLSGTYRYSDDNATAPEAWDNDAEFFEVWDDMIAAKRMTIAYTRPVIQRFNWRLSNFETFDMYKNDYADSGNGFTGKAGSSLTTIAGAPAKSLATAKFYVMNTDYEVFKCLYNGSSGANRNGINATVEPSTTSGDGFWDADSGLFFEDLGTSVATLRTAESAPTAYYVEPSEGYVWKFMYTLPINDVLRFLSTDFMPVSLVTGSGSRRGETEGLAEPGAIFSYVVENSATTLVDGNYYAVVTGDGTGAKVRFTATSGVISDLIVLERGSGYTYGKIVMEDGATYDGDPIGIFQDSALTLAAGLGAGVTDTAFIEAIISPRGGHGAAGAGNIERELNAKRIMTNVRLSYNEGEGDFPVDNDFRRIGIIKDPDSVANSPAIETTLNNLKKIRVSGVISEFQVDEEITQVRASGGIAKGRVVSWTDVGGGVSYITYYQTAVEHADKGKVRAFEGAGGANIIGTISGESVPVTAFTGTENNVTFANGLAAGEMVSYTGDVIYQENRRLITRAIDQIEDIKLVIEF